MKVIVVKDYEEVSAKAYEIMAELISNKPDCTLGLATGGTPVGLYKKLIEANKAGKLDFSKVQTVNLDEYVGIDYEHPESYHKFMNRNLFDHINIDKANTHVPDGGASDPQVACDEYNKLLASKTIDMQLLGIGGNGHIAFNEPGTPVDSVTHIVHLDERTIKDNARFFNNDMDLVPKSAMTMGIKNIMAAKKVLLLASGANKADAVFNTVEAKPTTKVPASVLQNHPDVTIICDEAAASKLTNK